MLHEAEEKGKLRGIKICSNAPSVNHLLFAHDSLLLIEVEEGNAKEFHRIYTRYL
jgi:hypothetical protein